MSAQRSPLLVLLGALTAIAFAGAWFAPVVQAPAYSHPPYLGPTTSFWLGTDALGRDLLPRLLAGLRWSLGLSVSVVLASLAVGLLIGAWGGYRGGWFDLATQRGVDILMAFPGLLLAIALAAFLGPGRFSIFIALASTGWIGFARLARGQALALRDRDFVQAAEGLGYPTWRILVRHMAPNLMAPLMVQASFSLAGVIMGESSLAFLGLGAPDTPSLGGLVRDGVRDLTLAPHLAMAPGAVLMMLVYLFNRLGERPEEPKAPADVENVTK